MGGSLCAMGGAQGCPQPPCPPLTPLSPHSGAPPRVPAASPSAHNVSQGPGERPSFPRGVSSRSTFHAGQLRAPRDPRDPLPYALPPGLPPPASPSGASQGRRGPSASLFSKFTSKFVRR